MTDFKDLKMIRAGELVPGPGLGSHPEIADGLQGKYRTIWDTSMKGGGLDNLEKAVNILADKGWKPVLMAAGTGFVYVMMERT